jgi:hypothetical protein
VLVYERNKSLLFGVSRLLVLPHCADRAFAEWNLVQREEGGGALFCDAFADLACAEYDGAVLWRLLKYHFTYSPLLLSCAK